MKASKITIAILAALALTASSCADMGFGVDVDSSGASPYLYGSTGYYGGPAYSPWFGYNTWNPPVIYPGPGPALPPANRPTPNQPSRPVRPAPEGPGASLPVFRPGTTINGSGSGGGVSGSPLIPGAGQGTRPGNGGLPGNPR